MAADVVALITAGGEGSRLMPHTRHLPKPLFPMGDGRLVDYAATNVAFADSVCISLRAGATDLLNYIRGNWSTFAVEVEDRSLGTAGSLVESGNRVLSRVADGAFLLAIPADHVTEGLDLSSVVAEHFMAGAAASQALLADTVNYGDYVWLDTEQRVVRVGGKYSEAAYSTTGIFVFSPDYLMTRLEQLRSLRTKPIQIDFYQDLYLDAVRTGHARGIPTRPLYWDDAGTAHRYWTNAMRLSAGMNVFSEDPRLDASSHIEQCVVLGSGDLRGVSARNSIVSWTSDDRLAVTIVD